jgi:hypothetical protein
MLRAEKAPGSDALVDCQDLKTLQQWWAQHGTTYLARWKE